MLVGPGWRFIAAAGVGLGYLTLELTIGKFGILPQAPWRAVGSSGPHLRVALPMAHWQILRAVWATTSPPCQLDATTVADSPALDRLYRENAAVSSVRPHLWIGLSPLALVIERLSWFEALMGAWPSDLPQSSARRGVLYLYNWLGWIQRVPPHRPDLPLAGVSIRPTLSSLLLDPRARGELGLSDPRSSATGLDFVRFTQRKLGSKFESFWRSLRHQWPTLTPGWAGAFRAFQDQQVALVWTQLTSLAGHTVSPPPFQPIWIVEGSAATFELALLDTSLVQGEADQRACAQEVLQALLQSEVQARLAESFWMLPVTRIPAGRLPWLDQLIPRLRYLTPEQLKKEFWDQLQEPPLEETLCRWRRSLQGGA